MNTLPLSATSDFTARQPVPGPMTRSAFSADLQATSDEELESLIRRDYERCHPGDTLDDLKRRAAFSKEDRGLLRDWMAIAAAYKKRCATEFNRGRRSQRLDTFSPAAR